MKLLIEKYFQSNTDNELENCMRIKNTIENAPDFFDVFEIFHYHITNYKKQFDLYLVNCDFKFVFHSAFYPLNKTKLRNNLIFFQLKQYSVLWIESFLERRHEFSYIYEMNVTIYSKKIKDL